MSGGGVHEETRMLTGTSPLARARMRAQGVVGRLRRMLVDRVGPEFEATEILPPSPGLQQAMMRPVAYPSTGAGLAAAFRLVTRRNLLTSSSNSQLPATGSYVAPTILRPGTGRTRCSAAGTDVVHNGEP